MTTLRTDKNVNLTTHPIRLRDRGQITIPQVVRDNLQVNEGDILTLLQVGDSVIITTKQPRVPQLIDKITAMMEEDDISLADLLEGLAEEREAIRQERHA